MLGPNGVTAIIAGIAGLAGGLIAATLWLTVWRVMRASPEETITQDLRVQTLTLMDDSGKERGLLRLLNGDAVLLLYDSEMLSRVGLVAGSRGLFLHFVEGNVNARLGIGILSDKSPGLELADSDGTPRASLSISANGSVSLALRDKNGGIRGSLQVGADGTPSLMTFDASGNALARLP